MAQYDEHTNSYAHHHKIRFRDMQASQRAQAAAQGVIDARREKERKREEKELKKLAKAHGVKIAAPNTIDLSPAPSVPAEKPKTAGGWAAVSAPAAPALPRFGNGAAPTAQPAPAFRTGGWSSLEDPSTQAHGPAAATHAPQPSDGEVSRMPQPSGSTNPTNGLERSGEFQSVPASSFASGTFTAPVNAGGFRSIVAPAPSVAASSAREGLSPAAQPMPASNSRLSMVPAASSSSSPALVPLDAPAKKTGNGKKKAKKEEAAIREQSRSGWQSFQRGGKR